jgi:hypothetical protein
MNCFTRWVAMVISLVLVQGCANNPPSQQMAAYSIATGFLTLCDDGDFDYALEHFGRPLKASPAGPKWTDDMQKNRATYGLPVIRSLVSRDGQNLNSPAKMPVTVNFVFRTSFIGTTPGEESVSVEKLDGRWQVYDYKFHPSGKPRAATPQVKIKKTWESQNDDDQQQ